MFKNLEKVKKQQQFDKFLTSNFFVCRIRNISYESGSNPCFVGSKTFFRFTYIVVLLCLLIFLYCILLFIIFISSTRRRGTICVAETSPQTGLTLAMMLSWGKACSTVPSGPLPPPFYKWISPGTVGGGWLAPPPPPESCIRPCLSKLQLDGFSCLGARNSSTWRVWALYRPTEKACPRTSLLSTTGLSATTRSCTTRRATCPSTARSSKTSLVRGFRLFFEYLKSPSAPVMMVILVLKSKGCHFEYCK